MIRVNHVNLRTLWIYRRIRKLARLATSNVSELPFSSTVAFFFSLSLNKSSNIIAHNLTFKFNPGRKERKRLRFVSQFLTHYLSLIDDTSSPNSFPKPFTYFEPSNFKLPQIPPFHSSFLLSPPWERFDRWTFISRETASSSFKRTIDRVFVQLTGRRFHDVASTM